MHIYTYKLLALLFGTYFKTDVESQWTATYSGGIGAIGWKCSSLIVDGIEALLPAPKYEAFR